MTSPMCVCVKEYLKNRNVQRSPAQRVAERVANLSGVRSSVNFSVQIVNGWSDECVCVKEYLKNRNVERTPEHFSIQLRCGNC